MNDTQQSGTSPEMPAPAARPKLTLSPAERHRAVAKGILAGLPPAPTSKPGLPATRQEAPGASETTRQVSAHQPTPDRPACVDSGRSAAPSRSADGPKPTLLQQLCADFGVEYLKFPLALGVGRDQPVAVRRRLGLLTGRPKYLKALIAPGSVRFNPDGSVSEPVSDQHRQWAEARLAMVLAGDKEHGEGDVK